MPSELPSHLLKLTLALIKAPAKQWMGEELWDSLGSALLSIGGEEAQQKLDDFLLSVEGTQELEQVAKDADAYFQANCDDFVLKGAFSSAGGFSFGNLADIQQVLRHLPKDLDAKKLDEALQNAIQRDLGAQLSAAQVTEAVALYHQALLRAVAPLKKYTLSIIAQTVLDNGTKLDALAKAQKQSTALLLAKLDALSAQTQRPRSGENRPTQPGSLPHGSYLPLTRNPIFTGRVAYLERLEKALFAIEDSENGILLTQAISGMGGIGKTQLAVEFAYRFGYRFKGVHWLSAASARTYEELAPAISICGAKMGLDLSAEQPAKAAQLTLEAWQAEGPRLIVVDNLEDADAAQAILPYLTHPHIRLLITSRYRDWAKTLPLEAIRLDEFRPAESLAFLRRHLGAARASDADLEALAARLGHLPLALELAGRYLAHRQRMALGEYVAALSLQHPSLSNWRKGKNLPNPTKHEQHVAQSFALSWQAVDDAGAQKIFRLAGYFAPNLPLPLQTLYQAGEFENEDDFEDALLTLKAYALLKEDESLHPLMAEFAALQNADANDKALSLRWAKAFAWQCYPGQKSGGIYSDMRLAQHARYALPALRAIAFAEAEQKENLPFHAAFLLSHFGDLSAAMQLYEEALKIDEGLGDLQGKSATLHQMAGIYVTRGDLSAAMQLYEEALDMLEGLGDLQGKAATLANIAIVLFRNQEYATALEYLLNSFQILQNMGAKTDLEAVANLLVQFKDALGAEKFNLLWAEVTDGAPLPPWLSQ